MFLLKRFCLIILILTGLMLPGHPARATVDVTTGFVSERKTTFISLHHEDVSPFAILVAELPQNVNALDNVFHRLQSAGQLLSSHPKLAIDISDDAYQRVLSTEPKVDGFAVLSLENGYRLDLDPHDILSADTIALGPVYRVELALWPVSYNELLTLVLLLPRLNAENPRMELLAADIRQYRDKFDDEITQQSIMVMGSYTDLLWSPDGNLLLLAHWSDRGLSYQVFNFAANELMSLDRLEHYILPPTFTPDSRYIIYSSQTELRIVDVKKRRTTGFSLREMVPGDYQNISIAQFAANKTGDTLVFSFFGWGMTSPPAFLWRSADPGQLEKISGLEFMEKPELPGETWSDFLRRSHASVVKTPAEFAELKGKMATPVNVELTAEEAKLQARYGAIYSETINYPRNDYLAVLIEDGNRLKARVFSLPSLEERSIYTFAFMPETQTETPGAIAAVSLFNAVVIALISMIAAAMTKLILFVKQNIYPAAAPISQKKKLLLFTGALLITLLLHFAATIYFIALIDDNMGERAFSIAQQAVTQKYAALGYTVEFQTGGMEMIGSSPLWFADFPYQALYWRISGFARFAAPMEVALDYRVFDQQGNFVRREEVRYNVLGENRLVLSPLSLPSENEAKKPATIPVYRHKNAQAVDEALIPRDVADNFIREFAASLNAGDAVCVLEAMTWLAQEVYNTVTIEYAEAALDNYRVYLGGEKIEKAAFMGPAPFYLGQGLIYRLYASGGKYKEVFLFRADADYLNGRGLYDELFVYDNILNYSYRANVYLDMFVNALRENRPEEIASLLTHDNFANPYPEFKAGEAIRNYGRLFDLLTVSYVFVGTETRGADSPLLFELRGSKGDIPAIHGFEVIYGDGLVTIRDELIPPKPIMPCMHN